MIEKFEATLTSKGQITVPADVRKFWNLKPGDQIRFGRLGRTKVRSSRCGDGASSSRDALAAAVARQAARRRPTSRTRLPRRSAKRSSGRGAEAPDDRARHQRRVAHARCDDPEQQRDAPTLWFAPKAGRLFHKRDRAVRIRLDAGARIQAAARGDCRAVGGPPGSAGVPYRRTPKRPLARWPDIATGQQTSPIIFSPRSTVRPDARTPPRSTRTR